MSFLMKKRPARIAAPFQCPLLHFYFLFLPVRYAVSEINKKKAARENHQKSKNIYLERILLFLVGERGIKETEREEERVRSHEDQKKSFKRWNTIKIRIRRHKRTCASSDLHDSQLVVEVEMFRPGVFLFSIIIIILITIDL